MTVVLKSAPVCQQRLAKGTSIYIDGLGTNISHLKRSHFAAQPMTDKTVSLPNGSDTATFRDVPRSYLRTLESEHSEVMVNDGAAEDNILIQTAIARVRLIAPPDTCRAVLD
jgi:hypothetical protein